MKFKESADFLTGMVVGSLVIVAALVIPIIVQAQVDDYRNYQTRLESPAVVASAITPSDSVNQTNVCRAIYVGGAGDIVAVLQKNTATAVTFVGATAGSVLPIRATRINSSGTTATNLVCIY